MKNTINKIKKGGKIYSKILFLVIIGISILFMVNIINIKKVTVYFYCYFFNNNFFNPLILKIQPFELSLTYNT